jgi:hypothetical protein
MPPKRNAGAKKKPVKALAREDSPMSDTDITDLWCYIEGDKRPFLLTVSSSIMTEKLKQIIVKEKHKFLPGVDASELTLWKVRYMQ